MLTIARWGIPATSPAISYTPLHTTLWKARSVSLADLSKKLKKEKFGGRDIEGLGGIQLQAYSLAQLAGKYAKDGHPTKAQETYVQSLIHLESLVSSTAKAEKLDFSRLLGGTTEDTSKAAMSYNFAQLVDAIPPSAFRLTLPQYLDAYATVLTHLDFIEEPMDAMQQSVKITREALLADPELSQEALGLRLVDFGYYLELADHSEDAARIADEAISIWRQLHQSDPARYRDQLATLLDSQVNNILTTLEDIPNQDVYRLMREVLSLTRESYSSDPHFPLPDLVTRLNACSNVATRLGYHHDALVLSFDSLSLTRAHYKDNPNDQWHGQLCNQLVINADLQAKTGHLTSALTTMREAMVINRERYLSAPDNEYQQIGHSRNLYAFGDLFSKSDQPAELEEALAAVDETLELRRMLLTTQLTLTNPVQNRTANRNVDSTLALRSKILDKLHRTSAALEPQRELVNRIRNSTVLPIDDPKRRALLGTALQDLARYAQKAQLPDESMGAASEALVIARELHTSNPEIVDASMLESAILLDHAQNGTIP